MTDSWNVEKIRTLLLTNDRAVERALVALATRQTQDEFNTEQTRLQNGIGFTGSDAKIMTSMAKQVSRGRTLTEKQLAYLRSGKSDRFPHRICKYARQLLEISQEKKKVG